MISPMKYEKGCNKLRQRYLKKSDKSISEKEVAI